MGCNGSGSRYNRLDLGLDAYSSLDHAMVTVCPVLIITMWVVIVAVDGGVFGSKCKSGSGCESGPGS